MAFPASPSNNQVVTVNNIAYIYSSASNSWTRTVSANIVIGSVQDTTAANIGALVVPNGGASIAGNLYVGNNLYIGPSSFATTLTTPTIVAVDAGSTYAQLAMKNTAGTGSSDFAAYADNGADSGGWVDMGIAGSTFSDANYTITRPQDGYLITRPTSNIYGGNLVIGTSEAGSFNDITLSVGSFFANAEVARFHGNTSNSGYLALKQGTNATSTTSGALQVTGGVGISGNLWSGNLNTTTATATNITVTANITRNNRNVVTNFTGNTAPATPLAGDEWFRANTSVLYKYIYDGTSYQWVDLSSVLYNANTQAVANTIALRDSGGNLTATNFLGVASSAKYADLAEIYIADTTYEAGAVVVFGGTAEITATTITHDTRVAGVISTNPAYLMNSEANGLPVAFTGRVPCKVRGPVKKGDVLVTSAYKLYAEKIDYAFYKPGCVLGKALGDVADNEFATIEVVVGRF